MSLPPMLSDLLRCKAELDALITPEWLAALRARIMQAPPEVQAEILPLLTEIEAYPAALQASIGRLEP